MNLVLVGYGRMGRAVEAVALERGHRVAARIGRDDEIPVGPWSGADVAVEFTHPDAAVENVQRLAASGLDVVVGTTGWYERLDEVRTAAETTGVGVVYAPNFSLGVQLLFRTARTLGRLVDRLDEYDVHLHEVHHRHKVDHPSGTARTLAEIVLGAVGRKERWTDRPPEGPADPATLQVSSVRVGEVPGTHVLGVDGPDDRLELRHEARSRSGFARGAVVAAEWIRGRSGLYTLDDVLADLLDDVSDDVSDDGP